MKPVLTATEYSRVDKSHRGDIAVAMERAGHAVALAAARHGAGYGARVVVLAGPGNNGGDGYVAARHLRRRGAWVEVSRMGEPRSEAALHAQARARQVGVPIRELAGPVTCDLVIDALFGGGGRAEVPKEVMDWMEVDAPVIAVDFPTGLDPDTGRVPGRAFRAVETVTFNTLKTGHVCEAGPEHCGKVTVVDIGIPGGRPSMYLAEEGDAPRPTRSRTAHKWSAGSVLVVGGSAGMVGAAALAARGALNFGAGSVYIASSQPDQAHLIVPQVPAISFDDTAPRLDRFAVIVVGPGLAAGDLEMVLPMVRKARSVVLDAGGLVPEMLKAALDGEAQVVVTPHAAEFERIAGTGGGKYSIRAFAGDKGLVVLYKGNPTMVTDGGLPVLVTSGGPELATVGTGDVLAGMLGALWARGLDPVVAAVSAAYWHGVTGADLRDEGTVTADRVADRIGTYAW